ncbi:hypothetical protein MIN45_P1085 [Methylomarinovum tepidoasis]|uniref:Uncharacterized protein n=1 Tax=Methylomarinovum tepidoasis TaxID=2840183 RepID=A0AAU9CH84_9GAMM|nr:alkaline phosphatase family protein [Methylomarinovum sp. IN45]BCX88716.1 hypothetical protein MIN45_P1085 [Methylomarinovum sp. IN45]
MTKRQAETSAHAVAGGNGPRSLRFKWPAVFGWLRHYLDRSEWFIRLLKLPCFEGPADAPGLILIQIDGLAHRQLQRALEQGRMPFLQRLLTRGGYRLHRQYAGLPATTPACQGLLFYGVPRCVPAFSFRDPPSGEVVRMYEPGPAAAVEAQLRERGTPLLSGGSAYVDTFTGGAAEAHFCPAALGWGPPLKGISRWKLALFTGLHLPSLARIATLLAVELGLAVTDCLRGIVAGEDFFKELKFIPTRVGIVILLRELAVIGARIDAARGLPVIHLNLLGYDEQAHRRGPDSRFAHWTLKGIDAAIARLHRSARRSRRRRYQVWVYSDHGQERVTPYVKRHGRHLDEAVSALLADLGSPAPLQADVGRGIQTLRVRWLGGRQVQRLFPVNEAKPQTGENALAALGPVGHLYLGQPPDPATRRRLARELTGRLGIPLVLACDGDGVRAWTAEGEFRLPAQAAALFGADHPWRDRLGEDWAALCRHPAAGDLVLVGWRAGCEALTFAVENGAHAGAGPDETTAFACLPADAPLPEEPMTAEALRRAVEEVLRRP